MTQMSAIKHFLLVFNHEIGKLVQQQDFGTRLEEAITEYSRLEREYKNSPMMDIVLVGSDSIETVRITHANYFDGSAKISSKYLAGL
ncbi:MAG: hypothetical protein ACTHMS_13140 [Jatrophihabitans sp.]|uniref:hypothetical protein n=1 Tax=Jatrophihabitans sp. TaxID=1932789 RepID=UPI003F81A5A8